MTARIVATVVALLLVGFALYLIVNAVYERIGDVL